MLQLHGSTYGQLLHKRNSENAERDALITHMRAQGRRCFVSPTSRGFTTVYDRECEQQDVRDLEALALDLSSRFHCAAFAVLNHHDDILWMGLARDGEWLSTYHSDKASSGSAWQFASQFEVLGLLPLLWLLMRWPFVLFEIWRHMAIASTLGIPNFGSRIRIQIPFKGREAFG